MKRRMFVYLNRTTNLIVRGLRLRRFMGGDLLVLETVGRRSGQRRSTPLLYLREPQGWVVVASNGGADWEPGWWLNLKAGSPALVRANRSAVPVVGAEVTGAEREDLWTRLNNEVTDYASYQRKVSRQLAVVRLTPIDG